MSVPLASFAILGFRRYGRIRIIARDETFTMKRLLEKQILSDYSNDGSAQAGPPSLAYSLGPSRRSWKGICVLDTTRARAVDGCGLPKKLD